MSTPSPSNVGRGAVEERDKATKTVKAEAGEDDGAGAFINIKVQSQTADDVWFRIKRYVKLGRVMDMYCSKQSLHPMAIGFLHPAECRLIRRNQTPDEICLEDGDEINVILRQPQEGCALINIKVQSQTADDVVFRVKRDVKLRRLMDMYCGKHSLHPLAVRFLDPGGRPIRPNQTPDEIGLKDGDAIDIMLAFINIKVHSETANDDLFRIKRDLKLQRLMDMYCGKHSLNPKSVVFLDPKFRIIRPHQTPDEIGLKDGDAIDIILTQEGGAAREPEMDPPEICMRAADDFSGLIRH